MNDGLFEDEEQDDDDMDMGMDMDMDAAASVASNHNNNDAEENASAAYTNVEQIALALEETVPLVPSPAGAAVIASLTNLMRGEFMDVYREWLWAPTQNSAERRTLLMSRFMELWGLDAMASPDSVEQRFSEFIGRIQVHEEVVGRVQRAWGEGGVHVAHIREAREACETMCVRLLKTFYYMRRMVHDYISSMELLDGTLPFASAKFYDGMAYLENYAARSVSQLPRTDIRLQLVEELLKQFQILGYRRKKDSEYIYEQRAYVVPGTGQRVLTYCYQPTVTIEDVIYRNIQMDTRADLFAAITHRGIVEDIVNLFRKHHFLHFPFLQELESFFSFPDGVWDAQTDKFCYYDQVPKTFPKLCQGYVTYNFIECPFAPVYFQQPPRPVLAVPGTPASSVASRMDDGEEEETPYHHQDAAPTPFSLAGTLTPKSGASSSPEFSPRPSPHPSPAFSAHSRQTTEAATPASAAAAAPVAKLPWRSIQNPMFEKIFRDQQWCDEAIELRYAMMGRTLWRSGLHDNWQCVLIDIGESGTGKSTAQKVWQRVFPFPDVMIFGDNQEKSFSRDKIAKARIYLAPDMRGDSFGITPEFFLTLATQDAAVLPRKHRDPLYVEKLDTPGMLATNELPACYRRDVRGSIFRRLCPFGYTVENLKRDPTLGERIVKYELAGVLRKAAVSYMSNDVYDRELDLMTRAQFPPEIQNERDKIERSSNSLLDFLMTPDYATFDPNELSSMTEFGNAYNAFCKSVRRDKAWQLNEDTCRRPFRLKNLTIETGESGAVFVRGIRVSIPAGAADARSTD